MTNYMSNRKAVIICSIVWLMKKVLRKMSQYFPKPYDLFGGNVKVELDLSNYATKTHLKVTKVYTSKLAGKSDLASLKAELSKLDVDKLNTVPNDLSKLRNIENNEVAKKTGYDKLAAKVNNIDTSELVLKTMTQIDQIRKKNNFYNWTC